MNTQPPLALFPSSVIFLHGAVTDWQGPLWPEEAQIVEGSVEKRRQEFIAGRCLARQALQKLGIDSLPLLRDPDRSPVWPLGVVGSLTHTNKQVAVAVGWKREVRGIGLDVEEIDRVTPFIWEKILIPPEQERIQSLPISDQGAAAAHVFAAKEAFYKYYFPQTRTHLGFLDLEILPHPDGRHTARLHSGQVYKGRYLRQDNLILASFYGGS